MLTQLTVGWLLLVAAVLTFVGGFLLRAVIGRHRNAKVLRRVVRALRNNVIGRVFFGPVFSDALDDDELDQMILMPAIILSCALCLTSIFLLGYEVLA
jgi:formate-dependent nitrite reductase membrane component NrfD